MYFIPPANDRPHQVGLRGFSDPPLPCADKTGKDAIQCALQLNLAGGYVKGSLARIILDKAFDTVPLDSAGDLAQQLEKGQDPLGKLFRYRLHTFTQETMLKTLKIKEAKYRLDLKNEADRRAVEAAEADLLKRCAPVIALDKNLKQICSHSRVSGTKYCQDLRDEARKTREIFERTGDRCP